MKRLSRICVIYNLPGTSTTINIEEADDDTKQSANSVYDTLKKCGYEVEIKAVGKEDIESLKDIDTDLVFNLVEWSGKETELGVRVIKNLEEKGIAFTGSGSSGYELSSNKVLMKKRFEELGIPSPKYQIYDGNYELGIMNYGFPVIVKPALEHCGIGLTQMSVVNTESELRIRNHELWERFNQPILNEEYIEGREIQVTVFEKDGKPWVLPPAEVSFFDKPGRAKILTYDAKWNEESEDYGDSNIAVVQLSSELGDKVNAICVKCYEQMDGRDYPRIDMRIKGNEVYVLEINNNPGMGFDTESGIGLSARAVGLNYETMLSHIVENAYSRYATV
ncbi:MAG: hypothetical protein AAB909_04150 [Patescibacteria group bacterium]